MEGRDLPSCVLGTKRDTFEPTPKPTPDLYESGAARSSDSGEMFARVLEILFPTHRAAMVQTMASGRRK